MFCFSVDEDYKRLLFSDLHLIYSKLILNIFVTIGNNKYIFFLKINSTEHKIRHLVPNVFEMIVTKYWFAIKLSTNYLHLIFSWVFNCEDSAWNLYRSDTSIEYNGLVLLYYNIFNLLKLYYSYLKSALYKRMLRFEKKKTLNFITFLMA